MSSEPVTEQVTSMSGESYAVGPLDVLLILSFIGFIIYYFMKPKSDVNRDQILKGLSTLQPISKQESAFDNSNFVSKMKKSGKKIAIFYGSQTGTAEEFSNRLAKDANRYGLKAGVFDPEECEMSDLLELRDEIEDCLTIFVMATYGEGDPTDNAVPFYEWLHEEQDLSGLNYAVFALGNKTYEHYQSTGRYVDKRVEELGGVRVFERGEGDDDGNIEEDFVEWRERFWPAICKHYGIEQDQRRITRGLSMSVSRDYELKLMPDVAKEKVFSGEMNKIGAYTRQRPPYDAKNPYLAPISVNRELHSTGDRSCMHIELDIAKSGIRYEAGDHVAIYPTNDQEMVEQMGKMLGVDLDTVMSMVNTDPDASKKNPFPCPTTYRTALSHYIDISNTVKHHVLSELVQYTSDPEEKQKILKMADHDEEGKKLYNEWIIEDHRNIVTLLEDMPSCRPPLDLLLELLPRLQCRYYSISSSPKMHKTTIHVTAVVVDWITPAGHQQKGVATTWLKTKMPEGDKCPRVPIFVRHTQFRLPDKTRLPVIMVGPGTGLAPFRGFIQERHMQREKGLEVGETILYFGCRRRDEDYLYKEELESYESSETITKLNVAFSREQAQKVYVTHQLRENMENVWNVIKNGGHLYVCGDAKSMARDVHEIFIEAIKLHGGKTQEQADGFIKKLSNTGKYSVDVWS